VFAVAGRMLPVAVSRGKIVESMTVGSRCMTLLAVAVRKVFARLVPIAVGFSRLLPELLELIEVLESLFFLQPSILQPFL